MNKKLLILSAILTISLAITPLQANWQDWIPSKKALLIGAAGTAVTWAIISKIFYNKYAKMHADDKESDHTWIIKVKRDHADTDDDFRPTYKYHPKSKLIPNIPYLTSWYFTYDSTSL